MRTEAQAQRVHELAVALLERRGIRAQSANFEQYADACEIAAEQVERGRETVAEMLAGAAIGDDATDVVTTEVLARFATRGEFVADLSLDEESFLRAAIAAEQDREQTTLAEARAREERRRVEKGIHPGAVQTVHGEAYCATCDYSLSSGLCKC